MMLFGLTAILVAAWSAWRCYRTALDLQACPTVGEALSPSLTALGFLATAYIAWRTLRPFPVVMYFWLGSMALIAGLFSGIGAVVGAIAFHVALVWLPPVGLRFHLALLGRPLTKGERTLVLISVALAAIWTTPLLAYLVPALPARDLTRGLFVPVLLTLVITLVVAPFVLWRGYRSGLAPAAARQIRLVAIGSSLAFAPLALLSILPGLVGSTLHVPYSITFPSLLLSPLFYLYISFRSRLAQIEPYIDRVTVVFLLSVVCLSVYMVAHPLVSRVALPSGLTLIVMIVAAPIGILLFRRLERAFEAFTFWSFEGDQPSSLVIDRLTEALSLTTDRVALMALLLGRLPQTLRAQAEVLALRTAGQELEIHYAAHWTEEERTSWRLSAEGALAGRLVALARPPAPHELAKLSQGQVFTRAEARVLATRPGSLLLPLVSGGSLQGILIVAGRTDDDPWRNEDFATLTILGRQVAATIQNLLLLETVRAGRNELARVHRQFVVSQERQQRQLAQDLHDGAVQHLLGISYQLADAQRRMLRRAESTPRVFEEIRAEVLAVSEQLRKLIGQLRPAALDDLGLVAALEGYVARVQRENATAVPAFHLSLDRRGAFLPEAVSICLFRTAQEGIRNALEHASASRIDVDLRVEGDQAVLVVQDDGCGFVVPDRLSELAQADHFGLVGIAERVAWIRGRFEIRSKPASGVMIRVTLPLAQQG